MWRRYGLHAPTDLQPFAVVIACEEEREKVKSHVNMDMLCGQPFSDTELFHPNYAEGAQPAEVERKVRHLIDAWDGLDPAETPT
jgi:hypothetical protein